MLQISAVKLDWSMEERRLKEWESRVSDEKRNQLSAFRSKEDRLQSVASEVLVRTQLCRELSVSNEKISFERDSFGKPFLKGNPLYFNVSRAAEWVVCAISDHPVGIDAERVRSDAEPYLTDSCSLREKAWLDKFPESERVHHYYRLWNMKKAFVKNLGCGFVFPPYVLSFHITRSGTPVLFFPGGYGLTEWTFEWGELDDKHKWAVCCSSPEQRVSKTVNTCAELHEQFSETWN